LTYFDAIIFMLFMLSLFMMFLELLLAERFQNSIIGVFFF
jgi:hypothetical protein